MNLKDLDRRVMDNNRSSASVRVHKLASHLSLPDCVQGLESLRGNAASCVGRNECVSSARSSNAKTAKKKKSTLIVDGGLDGFELPPVIKLADDALFPKFPEMKKDYERLGKPGVFTYIIAGGRRMTIVADRELYKVVFFPDRIHTTSNQALLAYHWFGIEKELSMAYTDIGLSNTRKALKQSKARLMNSTIGQGILDQFKDFGRQGEAELYDFAWLTFWPVNAALFGKETISPELCPHIRDDLNVYNSKFELVANGMPRKMFPEMEDAAVRISKHFGAMIDKGNAEKDTCPVLKARISAIDKNDTRWSSENKGRFAMSIYWAAQANTIPGTFWALALALANPEIKAKCIQEARSDAFCNQPNKEGKYEIKKLPYINAVVKEVLRIKVSNITHRKVLQTFGVQSRGKGYRIPKGDSMTVCSHLQHFDGDVYENPNVFRPERWLEGKKYPQYSFFPFGGGPNTCSGKMLAMEEIPLLLGLFFRHFDAELIDPLPVEEWDNVVAMVTPKSPFNCRIRYTQI
mmetsp:Transcript_45053/g.71974  ORF Transcript_45053/g.71974 Transcript_45053/m.71974 type:complete len:519 (+) Transcript_45053:3-1559(+)